MIRFDLPGFRIIKDKFFHWIFRLLNNDSMSSLQISYKNTKKYQFLQRSWKNKKKGKIALTLFTYSVLHLLNGF